MAPLPVANYRRNSHAIAHQIVVVDTFIIWIVRQRLLEEQTVAVMIERRHGPDDWRAGSVS